MQAAVFRGLGDLRIESVPVPSIRSGELLRRGRFLQIADKRCAENSHRQHPDAANRIQRERAAARTLLGSQAENGRPEKSFADAVKGRGGENGEHSRAGSFGQRKQSERGERGTRREQSERRQFVDERSGAET